jgi:predicted MPP superfamily phosphohydrolase
LTYIVFAIFTDGAALTVLSLYGAAASGGSAGVVAVMWLVWLFFLALVPKLLYTAGGVVDILVRVLARRRTAIFRGVALALSAVIMTVMIIGATAGRTQVKVNEVEICSDRVPAAFDGYRIAQFSDVHVGTMLNPEKQTERLAEKLMGIDADMVVFTGDLVNISADELTPGVMEILSFVRPSDGVWSVWGNHDLGFYLRDGASVDENFDMLSGKLSYMGWRALSDRSIPIRRGEDSIILTGIDYPRSGDHNGHNSTLGGADLDAAFSGVEGDPFNVVLAHTPLLWDEIVARGRGDLTLSGHVHSLQTKLRFFGKTFSPAAWIYDEWSGRYLSGEGKKNSVLYVNDGIGCVGYPMRIGARGEITVFTLKRCE